MKMYGSICSLYRRYSAYKMQRPIKLSVTQRTGGVNRKLMIAPIASKIKLYGGGKNANSSWLRPRSISDARGQERAPLCQRDRLQFNYRSADRANGQRCIEAPEG
mmetsp:Transcript_44848/g.82513  ORF Transcript_44848/g.82513 Transcript_44848/m.82513 type:complete len:105 (-) Transcript_44848:49-363(-)